ncbi:uncharacterized protein J3D65DRAFT_639156 [Phyllosticta citribraziliensis]|uniref:Uncharacterized protein n=1 Tax=Phyllosticta citribraziliensis TaxID=989973 RepID=A0ABR1L7Q1_9PEZI
MKRANNLPLYDGDPNKPPAEWSPFKGKMPKPRSSPFRETPTNWPRFVLLDRNQTIKLLDRFTPKDFPFRLPRGLVRHYVRNFDSEGYVVDVSRTAGLDWDSLPLNHQDLLLEPRMPSENTDEMDCEGADAAADASDCGSRSSALTQSPRSFIRERVQDSQSTGPRRYSSRKRVFIKGEPSYQCEKERQLKTLSGTYQTHEAASRGAGTAQRSEETPDGEQRTERGYTETHQCQIRATERCRFLQRADREPAA